MVFTCLQVKITFSMSSFIHSCNVHDKKSITIPMLVLSCMKHTNLNTVKVVSYFLYVCNKQLCTHVHVCGMCCPKFFKWYWKYSVFNKVCFGLLVSEYICGTSGRLQSTLTICLKWRWNFFGFCEDCSEWLQTLRIGVFRVLPISFLPGSTRDSTKIFFNVHECMYSKGLVVVSKMQWEFYYNYYKPWGSLNTCKLPKQCLR